MPSRRDQNSNLAQQQLEAAQARITELESQLLTERQHTKAEEMIVSYARRLQILRQIDLGIINANSTEAIIATALEHIRQLIPCQSANVSLIDMAQQEAVIYAVNSEKDTALEHGIRVPIPMDFFAGLDNRKLRVIEDLRVLERSTPLVKQRLDEGMLSTINVILMERDQPIGMLWLFANKTNFFTTEYQEIAVEIGNQLAIAIRQRQLSEQLAQHAAELESRVQERTLELQIGKARVEALLNNSPNGILLIEPDLSIQQTNTAFHKMLGFESDACVNRSLLELIHEADKDTVAKLVKRVIDEQTGKRAEVRVLRKDGTTFEAELAVELIEGDGLVCTIQDITERKAHERQLRYYASIQESVSDAVISTDMNLSIQSWNQAAERIFGRTESEVIGQHASLIWHPDYISEQERKQFTQEFLVRGAWERDVTLQSKDGKTIAAHSSANLLKDEKGQSIGIVVVIRDITEQKAYERQLRYYGSIQESVSDAVISTDMDFRIQSWNTAAEKIYGWTASEAIGKQATALLQTVYESEAERKQILQEFLEQGGWQREIIQRSKDGRLLNIQTSVNLFRDDKGQPIGTVSVNRDITERKRAELALAASESRYRLLAENIDDIIMTFSMDRVITYMSPSCERLLGYLSEEVVGKTHSEFIHPEDYPQVIDKTRQAVVLKANSYTNQFRLRHKDGHSIWYEVHTRIIYDPNTINNTRFISVLRDITERRRAEDSVRESEALYRLLADNVKDLIVRHSSAGIRTFVSPSCYALLGYHPEELVGHVEFDIVHPDDRPLAVNLLHEAIASGETQVAFTHRVQHKNGHYIWVESLITLMRDEITGAYLELIGVIRDITQRKRAEDSLRESEARYRLLADNSSDIIVQVNLSYDYTYASPSVERVLGYTPEEFVGKSTLHFIHPDDVPVVMALRQSLFLDEPDHNVSRAEFRYRHKQGHWVWLERVGTPLYPEGAHEVIGFLAALRDITSRRQAEEALRESESRYRLLTENITDVIAKNDADGIRTFVTSSVYDLVGYHPEELIGLPAIDIVHPDDRMEGMSIMEKAINTSASVFTLTQRVRHKDGYYVWIEVKGHIVWDAASNKPQEVIGVIRDITERKHAEDALRESEARYRLLAENVTDVIIKINPDGIQTFVTPSCYNLLGYLPEEMVGKSGFDMMYPADGLRVQGLTRQAIESAQASFSFTARIRHKDEHYVWVEVTNSIVVSEDGTATEIIGVIRDITARKKADTELRKAEERYHALFEQTHDAIFLLDMQGRVLEANYRAGEMLGYTDEEMQWLSIREMSDEVSESESVIRRLLAGESVQRYERVFRRKDGTRITVEINIEIVYDPDGNFLHIQSVVRDISDRKQAEDALRESEEKYRSLIETMRGGLAIYDPDDRFTYVNDRFCELLGYSREEIIGTSSMDYVDQSGARQIEGQLDKRQKGESSAYEIRARRKDGTYIHLLISGSPLLGKDGEYKGSFAVCVDITIQKEAEAALQQALAKEKELGDLKTRFVSMSSHEFRTPLATLLATVETLVAYRTKLSEEQIDQRLEKMKEQIAHLKNIMEDVLLLSRMQARRFEFNPTKVNLGALTRSVLDEFQSRPDVKHHLEYTASDSVQEVILDPKLMRQIISNLVSNAIKYSTAGKVVRVKLDCMDSVVTLMVSDEGIGIPDGDLPHLFEPFHRAVNAENISGTGLGLVITKEAVELHGGAIGVETAVGIGTTFIVRIPIPTPDQNGA